MHSLCTLKKQSTVKKKKSLKNLILNFLFKVVTQIFTDIKTDNDEYSSFVFSADKAEKRAGNWREGDRGSLVQQVHSTVCDDKKPTFWEPYSALILKTYSEN